MEHGWYKFKDNYFYFGGGFNAFAVLDFPVRPCKISKRNLDRGIENLIYTHGRTMLWNRFERFLNRYCVYINSDYFHKPPTELMDWLLEGNPRQLGLFEKM